MNPEQARKLVQETFTQKFDKGRFMTFIGNLLNHIDVSNATSCNFRRIKDAYKPHIDLSQRIGTYTSPDNKLVDVLIVRLTSQAKLVRTRTAIRNFVADYLAGDSKHAALVAFVSPSEDAWRFSYVKMEYATVEKPSGDIGAEPRLTPARRFSYLVGPGESCHTAQTRFLGLLQNTQTNPRLEDIEEAFSVEAVTKEFFARYKELALEVKDELDKLALVDKAIGAEFAARNVNTIDFAKKLMGQIVFLYFLQKKGWLGVEKGGQWGAGPHNFLRKLSNGDYGQRENFFNDTLEPLFYDTLATDRGHEAFCEQFNCRIPFLNGGLFEPLNNYDWRKTEILLPDRLFTNTEPVEPRRPTEEAITGTGILDVFDRYNFTVNEAEPLEKEVAIDPEMLGKVFENLLEVKERKSKGSFYTPREIVHYMCQESLINYLDTAANTPTDIIPRANIEEFIHHGDRIADYDAVNANHGIEMPTAIKENARLLDEKLAAITVCDPAVGSGAFLVGMMQEIVRARYALTRPVESRAASGDPSAITKCADVLAPDAGGTPAVRTRNAGILPASGQVSTCSTPGWAGEESAKERSAYHFKRHAIQSCLYGVDIDPGAVEIAKLRLWLSLVVDEEDVRQIKPLPNLDYKVVAGNSLLGFPYKTERLGKIEALKAQFFGETDHNKKMCLKAEIDGQLSQAFTSSKRSVGYEVNFDFHTVFSEIFHSKRGFDVVIGNPPYLFARNSKEKGITAADKKIYSDTYKLAEYQVNLYPLFIEKGTGLLRDRGSFAFITPNNWLTINTNGLLRRFILNQSEITIVNFYARMFASADVDSSIIVYNKSTEKRRVKLFEYRTGLEFVRETDCDFFLQQRDSIINIDAQKGDKVAGLMRKIDSQADRLGDVADVKVGLGAYGLGRGRPPQTDEMIKNRVYHSAEKVSPDHYKYIDGRDVCRYRLGWSGEFLQYGDHLREPRRDWTLFSSKRILVRQIPANPPYCIHACVVEETLLNDRNSMNIINFRESAELVLGILNARLTSFWFVHKFGKMQRQTFPQFKVNELAEFPLPKGREKRRDDVVRLVTSILSRKRDDSDADTSAPEREIDQLVYQLYDLTPEEIAIVEGAG